jgi:HlyD family secretion protein
VYSTDRSQSAYPAAAPIQAVQQLSQHSPDNSPEPRKKSAKAERKKGFPLFLLLCAVLLLPCIQGCGAFSKTEADAQSGPPGGQREGGPVSVNVAIAKTEVLQESIAYMGRTRPVREVSLRAQVEGRLLKLEADVGDLVKQGQILAQLDDSILVTGVTQAQAELAALQSEVTRAQSQVRNAQAQAEQAKAELRQAQVDAARLQSLQRSGAIPQQESERAQTAAATAQQTLNSATAQIATEQQAVAAAQGRVVAQRAVVAEAQERQSYTLIASPISGVVLEKVSEPGNLVQPGGEILKLGDFSQVKVVAPVTDSEGSNIRVGQSAQVKLDAFPNESFSGRVSRILPVANSIQFTVEITIPNINGQIGSDLFARVSFGSQAPRVIVPETALQEEGEQGTRGARNQGSRGAAAEEQGSKGARNQGSKPKSSEGTVFVVTGTGAQAKVQARRVQLGDRANGKVEIISGLKPGERFVAKSSKPLKNGAPVRLSALSEQ